MSINRTEETSATPKKIVRVFSVFNLFLDNFHPTRTFKTVVSKLCIFQECALQSLIKEEARKL